MNVSNPSDSSVVELNLVVVGLSGTSQVKGIEGVGKSSLCNRLLQSENYSCHQPSCFSTIDFYGDYFNKSHWIYWGKVGPLQKSRGQFSINIIEQTIILNEDTFDSFHRYSQTDYLNNATNEWVKGGPKLAFRSPESFQNYSNNNMSNETRECFMEGRVHGFIVVYDCSEVEKRVTNIQDTTINKLIQRIIKQKKPFIVALTKFDKLSQKNLDKFQKLKESSNFKSLISSVETSAQLNINISELLPFFTGLFELNFSNNLTSLFNNNINNNNSIKFLRKAHNFSQFNPPSYKYAENFRQVTMNSLLEDLKAQIKIDISGHYNSDFDRVVQRIDSNVFLRFFTRQQLKDHFYKYQKQFTEEINQAIMSSFIVLYKKLLYQFALSYFQLDTTKSSREISEEILSCPRFLRYFDLTNEQTPHQIFQQCYLSTGGSIKYPLPRLLIANTIVTTTPNSTSQYSQVDATPGYIEELHRQFLSIQLSDWLINKLTANKPHSLQYLDWSFTRLETEFSKQQTHWFQFRQQMKQIYEDFYDKLLLDLQLDLYENLFMKLNDSVLLSKLQSFSKYKSNQQHLIDDQFQQLSDNLQRITEWSTEITEQISMEPNTSHLLAQYKRQWTNQFISSLCSKSGAGCCFQSLGAGSRCSQLIGNLSQATTITAPTFSSNQMTVLQTGDVPATNTNTATVLLLTDPILDSCLRSNLNQILQNMLAVGHQTISLVSYSQLTCAPTTSYSRKHSALKASFSQSININMHIFTSIYAQMPPHTGTVYICPLVLEGSLISKEVLTALSQYLKTASSISLSTIIYITTTNTLYSGYSTLYKCNQISVPMKTLQTDSNKYNARKLLQSLLQTNQNNATIQNISNTTVCIWMVVFCIDQLPEHFISQMLAIRFPKGYTTSYSNIEEAQSNYKDQIVIINVVPLPGNNNMEKLSLVFLPFHTAFNWLVLNPLTPTPPQSSSSTSTNQLCSPHTILLLTSGTERCSVLCQYAIGRFILHKMCSHNSLLILLVVCQNSSSSRSTLDLCLSYFFNDLIVHLIDMEDSISALQLLWKGIDKHHFESQSVKNSQSSSYQDNHAFNMLEMSSLYTPGSASTSSTTLYADSSLTRSNIIYSNQFQYTADFIHEPSEIIICDSDPLGCFNEDKYLYFSPEHELDEPMDSYICDNKSIIKIHCSNNAHKDQSPDASSSACKYRSHSGPVTRINPSTTSSSELYSTVYNTSSIPLSRWGRSPAPSLANRRQLPPPPPLPLLGSAPASPLSPQSANGLSPLTTSSPNTQQQQQPSQQNSSSSNSSTKSFRNVFARLFSSERYSTKSAEDKRKIFRKSFRFGQKSSDKKQKCSQTQQSFSSNGEYHVMSRSIGDSNSDSFLQPYNNNNNNSLSAGANITSDLRIPTKSMSTFKNFSSS